ncbi:hypothetical protein [Piscinibacter gummiphilus]|uniref:Transposase TnpC homeodomain domain-containing protein n=1 Tax=Piscinibacter gummiphilus TaxID=946333 RepID=A0ABZ0CTM5_9BURK|nr:hypothetical protein [Piscinibacter gummiphilus]WOB06461.1 hypothetical protein RXV79_16185 [Piscinibacter gummiphilus]
MTNEAKPDQAAEAPAFSMLDEEFIKAIQRQRDTALNAVAQREAEVAVLTKALAEVRNVCGLLQKQLEDRKVAAAPAVGEPSAALASQVAPPGDSHPVDRGEPRRVPHRRKP